MERIAQLEKDLCEAIDSRDVAMANEADARSDCATQAREAREVSTTPPPPSKQFTLADGQVVRQRRIRGFAFLVIKNKNNSV